MYQDKPNWNVQTQFLTVEVSRCDRILWRGSEMYQLSYERKESQFSDHRPVCAIFWVSVEAMEDGSRKI